MRVLVIPDVHLKPWMFHQASELIEENNADRTVCLMDIADDWRQQFNLDLYIQTYDAAILFAREHPDTLWCYGNHDLCYPWNELKKIKDRFVGLTEGLSFIELNGLRRLCKTQIQHVKDMCDASDNLSSVQRKTILEHVVDSGLMTPFAICNFLDGLITVRKNMPNMKNAIAKWKDDRNHISSYRQGSRRFIAIHYTE